MMSTRDWEVGKQTNLYQSEWETAIGDRSNLMVINVEIKLCSSVYAFSIMHSSVRIACISKFIGVTLNEQEN